MRAKNMIRIELAPNLRELTQHGSPLFPCDACDEDCATYINGEFPWHWHEEFEINFITHGAMQISCNEQPYVIPQGDAIFVNSNVLHTGKRAPNAERGHLHALLFKPQLLGAFPEGAVLQQYVLPLSRCAALPAVHLSRSVPWQAEALSRFTEAFDAFVGGAYGWEMQVQSQLTELIRAIVVAEADVLARGGAVPDRDAARIRQMLHFIQTHYAEPINVSAIASAVSISESECYRCFKRMLNAAPADYLLQHRLRAAAGLLAGTDRSISDICLSVGFNSPSYFAKMFKQSLGTSPRAYRSAAREGALDAFEAE